MTFKQKFDAELKRLNITKEVVIKKLGVTRPTLLARLQNPNTFNVGEIKKLNKLGFNYEKLF